MYRKRSSYIFSILFILFFGFQYVYAIDMTSTNFIVRDPIIGTGGGYGTSASFSLIGAGNTLLSGIGTSASYIGHNGFLYYPEVTDVTLSAVQNVLNVDLSWPAAVATTGLGWVVSGYNTGISSVSGGPYTYTSVGNVTSYSYTGLTPGYYCFILQTLDGLGYVIATSNEVCLTIDPTITFDVDTALTDSSTPAPYNVSLGNLLVANASNSDNATINSIWLSLTTNAPSGAVVTVQSLNGALKSSSVPADTIPSATGTMTAGVANYGICVGSVSQTSGATLTAASPFNGATCTSGHSNTVGVVTTSAANILTASSGISGGRSEVRVNAENDTTTPSHNDYSDTLTFISTATF